MYYPGAHHVVEKNALNGVESAKFFQDRYYRSLGWETRVWKDINVNFKNFFFPCQRTFY